MFEYNQEKCYLLYDYIVICVPVKPEVHLFLERLSIEKQ